MRELYLSLADVLNNDAHNTSITEEQPADNTTSLCSVVSIWNEASAATDANLLQHHHLTAQKYWLPSWLACCRLATSTTATTKNVRIIVLPITPLSRHFTKSISNTVAQLNADVCWPSEWTLPSQPYDWRKRWDLVSIRNVKSEEQAGVSGGRLFHARTAATGKTRSPRVARRVI